MYSGNVNPGNFRTGLQEVFELLRVAKDKDAMEEFLKKNQEHYKNLEWKRGRLGGNFLDIPLIKEKGGINMCTAFQQMRMEGVREGIIEGERRGRNFGEEKLTRLIQLLFHDNRIDDLQRASFDTEYREKLYKEYGLENENL